MNLFLNKVRPEIAAGGVARDDGEIHFYVQVNALLAPQMTVVDLGCGRGAIFHNGQCSLREQLAKIQGKVAKTIGIDVDDAISAHPYLDERHSIDPRAPLPLADSTVDLVVAHWVLEHVDNPEHLTQELFRVLKPGGWICARTPHRFGYPALAAQIVPSRFHHAILRWVKPGFKEHDKFATVYKLNTRYALKHHFPPNKWSHFTYGLNSTPRYHFQSRLLFHVLSAYHAIAWPPIDLFVLIQKQ